MEKIRRHTGRKSAIAAGVGLALHGTLATAQDATTFTERVEVVGSRIRQIELTGTLPVQIVDREAIERGGFTSAADVLAHVSAIFNGFNPQLGIGSSRAGLVEASLRGLGGKATLVLLNGRRLANFAFDAVTVNLSEIPIAAIDRVEILKDGASSLYGTDAIAGVVNFVTRRDWRGVEIGGRYDATESGGGDRAQATLSAGIGDLARDRYNAFVVVDWQKDRALTARDRAYAATAYRPEEGINRLNPATFPASIAAQSGRPRPINPTLAGGCAPPLSIPFGFPRPTDLTCGFDFAAVIDIVPPVEQLSAVGRATWAFAPGHQAFVEAVYSRTQSDFSIAPTPAVFTSTNERFLYPAHGPYYPAEFAAANGLSGDLGIVFRTVGLGPRVRRVDATGQRWLVGAEGTIGRFDYSTAFVHSENRATETALAGLASERAMLAAMATGSINPFGPSGPEGDALLASTELRGDLRRSKGTTQQLDARVSGDLLSVLGGALSGAFGIEGRNERIDDRPGALHQSGDILGGGGEQHPVSASRDVLAAFAEFLVPFAKGVEVQLSARYDHYSDFGTTVNPKVALRWQPSKTLLLRGSWGKGYRAPLLLELFEAQVEALGLQFEDPLRCPVTELLSDCGFGGRTRSGGNPSLVPERSTQASAGVVWEPNDNVSVGLDAWRIEITDRIGRLPDSEVVAEAARLESERIVRGAVQPEFPTLPGPIELAILINENLGELRTAGVDTTVRVRSVATATGRWTFDLSGTWIHKWEQRLPGADWVSALGNRDIAGPVPRWKHYASLGWNFGPWSAMLAQTFQTGYQDQTVFDAAGNPLPPRRVGTWSVWDTQVRYTGFRNFTLTGGIRNLFDRDPPFTRQSDTFQVGYDPRYADPRGRTYYAAVRYTFR